MLKKTIFKMVLFAGLFFLIDYGLYELFNMVFHNVRSGEITGGYVNRVIKQKSDVVILGSSRAQCHYDPFILEKALNMTVCNAGANGQGLPYIRAMVDLLLRKYTPELFIINIDPQTIAKQNSQSGFDRLTRLSGFINESEVLRQMLYTRSRFEPIKYFCKSFCYNSKIISMIDNLIFRKVTQSGFNPLDRMLITEMKYGEETQERGKPADVDNQLLDLLKDSVRQAQKAGAKVVLVNGPYWQKDFKIDPQYALLFILLEQFISKNKFPFHAITQENTPAFQDSSVFADTVHLNRQGSEIFSKMLADWLIEKGFTHQRDLR